MLRSTLSVLGLYNIRPDIFDKFKVPAGVDKDILEPELLAEVAELESLYTDPDILKDLIGAWSKRRLYAWTKLYATTKLEYDPIYNKDAYYEESEDRSLSGRDRQDRNLTTTGESDSLHSVYGYDSGDAQPAESDHAESVGKDSGTIDGNRSEKENITRKRREYGNIGVTTTQHMIQEERDIADFDIYQYIITDFKYRFCVMVY